MTTPKLDGQKGVRVWIHDGCVCYEDDHGVLIGEPNGTAFTDLQLQQRKAEIRTLIADASYETMIKKPESNHEWKLFIDDFLASRGLTKDGEGGK